MKMNKLLSVSIAAYQVESTIEKCLDSFLPSKYLSELELLVINDGSKDKTAEIVARYEDKYPNVIKLVNKKNGGHGSTINKSLELATGKFYKIIDGDDWVDSVELDKLMDFLRTTDAELVVNRYREVYPEHSRVIGESTTYVECKTYKFADVICKEYNPDSLIAMHKTTILTSCLRNVNMKISENCFYADTEFIYYVGLAAETIAFHNSCVYQYRLGMEGQSVSSSGIYKHVEDMLKIERKLINQYVKDSANNISNEKKIYLFTIVCSRYDMLFYWYICYISKADKDYMFFDFIKEMKCNNAALLNAFYLSKFNKVVSICPKLFIPGARFLRQGPFSSVLRKCKNFVCGKKIPDNVIEEKVI